MCVLDWRLCEVQSGKTKKEGQSGGFRVTGKNVSVSRSDFSFSLFIIQLILFFVLLLTSLLGFV